MNILVIGGTRFIGKHLVNALLENNHIVTIATRGLTQDNFEDKVQRIIFDRNDEESIQKELSSLHFDVVYDSLAYASNDVKRLLSHIHCHKYIMISTAAVYKSHGNILEKDFDPSSYILTWCNRSDFPYDEVKRQAECALVQSFSHVQSLYPRFPFVIGEDDYTHRLKFYVEYVINKKPMFIDNIDEQLSFVHSQEAGEFLAFLSSQNFVGAINGANIGSISIKEILEYIQDKTKKVPILSENGAHAPYNGLSTTTLNIETSQTLGFSFSPLKDWIFNLIDLYINELSQ